MVTSGEDECALVLTWDGPSRPDLRLQLEWSSDSAFKVQHPPFQDLPGNDEFLGSSGITLRTFLFSLSSFVSFSCPPPIPFSLVHSLVLSSCSDTASMNKFHWLFCDEHRKYKDTALVPGVTYFLRTRYCSKSSSFTCGKPTSSDPPRLSFSKDAVPGGNPSDFGVRVAARVAPGVPMDSLVTSVDQQLLIPGLQERVVLQVIKTGHVLFDIIPASGSSPSPALIADRLRMVSSIVTVENLSIIRRCPGGKFQEDCRSEETTVLLTSSNILYFGAATMLSLLGCWYVRQRASDKVVRRSGDKHGQFQHISNEEDELEMQHVGASKSKSTPAAAVSITTAGAVGDTDNVTATLAQKDFRVLDPTAAESVKVMGESEPGSAAALLRRVLQDMGIPEIGMKRYLGILDDKWISRTEQLRAYDSSDWKRVGFPEIIEAALRDELRTLKLTNPKSASTARGLSLKKPVSLSNKTVAAPATTSAAVTASVKRSSSLAGSESILQSLDALNTNAASSLSSSAASSTAAKPSSSSTLKKSGSLKSKSALSVSAADIAADFEADFDSPSVSIQPHVRKNSDHHNSGHASKDEWPTLALDSRPSHSDDADVELDAQWSALDKDFEDLDMSSRSHDKPHRKL